MKAFFALLCVLTAFPAAAAETPVAFRLETSVSTRTAQAGDALHMRTATKFSFAGQSIPIGSYTRGVIRRSQRAGRIHGRAELEIRIDSIVLPDGTMLAVNGTSTIEPPRRMPPASFDPTAPMVPILAGIAAGYGGAVIAARHSNSEETIAGTGAVSGLSVGVGTGILMAVLKRGEDLELRPGTEIEAVLQTN